MNLHQMDLKNDFVQENYKNKCTLYTTQIQIQDAPKWGLHAEEAFIWLKARSKSGAFEDYAISSPTWSRFIKIKQYFCVRNNWRSTLFVILYVDDMAVGGESLGYIEHVKKTQPFGKFEMKDMDELHYFLRIEVIRTPDRLNTIMR